MSVKSTNVTVCKSRSQRVYALASSNGRNMLVSCLKTSASVLISNGTFLVETVGSV